MPLTVTIHNNLSHLSGIHLMLNYATLQRLIGIALLREGPQNLPASQNLMFVLALATAAINYPGIVLYTPDVQPLLQLGLLLGFNAAFVYIALALRNLRPRFVQSMSALFGTDALISAVALPVLFLLGPPAAGEAGAGSGVAAHGRNRKPVRQCRADGPVHHTCSCVANRKRFRRDSFTQV